MRAFLIRSAFTGFALWVATLIVPGLNFVYGDDPDPTTMKQIVVVVVVALVFGVVNAFIKPIVQILSIPLYILTLGLIHIVINAFMLEITAWITRNTTHWGLEVESFFWAAIWGAVVISIVGWAIDMLLKEPVR
ncbi:phage holin family protein [Gordonia sp. CPCC 205515]|uniref:phage holin family protein n=1 Tax=Gordonia sp. CPCC 205515 TaxID=3140791 RepID=UPI003AF39800